MSAMKAPVMPARGPVAAVVGATLHGECARCGTPFVTTSNRRKYCTTRCGTLARKQPGHKPAVPFTLEHFRAWAAGLILDDGEPFVPEPWEEAFLADLFGGIPECWLVVPEENGKALDVATPIPTPTGWTTMGNLSVGDEVLGARGEAVRVTFATEVMYGHQCYEVRFSDGASIIADAGHLWAVEGGHDHYRPRVLSTAQLLSIGVSTDQEISHRAHRWRVRTAARQGADRPLPIDPYVLGAWLGDGHSANGRMTNMDEEVWARVGAAGYSLGTRPPSNVMARARTQTILGLAHHLRSEALLGQKRIPERYLLASFAQRVELLRGLLDTDGTVSQAGQVVFEITNPVLARDVQRLAWSLGRPASIFEDRATLNGRDIGPRFRLTISCDARHELLGLSRKAARLKPNGLTTEHRRIVAIEPVPSRPVRCIQVSARDSLYLAGEAYIPTHNTTFLSAVALYHAEFRQAASVPVAASSREQSEVLYRQAEGFVLRSPSLHKAVFSQLQIVKGKRKTDVPRYTCLEGYRRINHFRGGRIQVFAADDRTGDGIVPTLAIAEELHRHRDLRLYRTWAGKLRKRGGQIAVLSTSGEPESEFEQTLERIRQSATVVERKGGFTRYVSGSVALHQYAVPEGANVEDMAVVKSANPSRRMTIKALRAKFTSPTMTLAHWRRFVCNQPTRDDNAAITEAEWAAAKTDEQIPEGEPIWLGLDVAWKWDTTAAVPLWLKEPKWRLFGPAAVLVPPRDGSTLHPDEIKRALREIHKRNPIHTVVMDTSKAEDIGAWIEEELGAVVIDRPQTNPHAANDYSTFMEALRNGWLHHTGDADLTRHVLNAVARLLPLGDSRFDRPNPGRLADQNRRVIDGLSAASMVHSQAIATVPVEEEVEPMVLFGRAR